MNNPMKAALLSAFIYPGMGHFFLRKYAMCVVLVSAFSVPLYFIISEVFSNVERVVEQIKNGEIQLDIAVISESISSSVTSVDAQEFNIKMYVLVIVWLVGIIDSYRLGRTKT
jgi:hypothetical protein